MSKSGLITFHYGVNFGGVLQALALQRAMAELGREVEVIDYVPAAYGVLKWWQGWNLRGGPSVAAIRSRLIRWRHERPAMARFEAFRNAHMRRSRRVRDTAGCQALFNEYDLLVAGSDQIWHFDRSDLYFLATSDGYSGRKISYASCCGNLAQPDSRRPAIRSLLAPFARVSVRNDFSARLIEDATGNRPEVVADPTLLVDLNPCQIPVRLPFDRFIFCYFLGDEILGGHGAMLKEIRRRVGDLPVVSVVAASHRPAPAGYADLTLYDSGPGEWLWLIQNAEFVYTDSYHGLLFALRNGRPALAYYREALRAPRMIDLADRYELHKHIVPGVDAAVLARGWDSPAAAGSLSRIRDHAAFSLAYLEEAMG